MLKTLFILSLLSENVLFINRPINSKYALITFDYNTTKSVKWRQMQYDFSIYEVPLYKINISSFMLNNTHFKVNYVFKNFTLTSNWQPIYNLSANNSTKNEKSGNYNFLGWVLLVNSYLCFVLYIIAAVYVIKKKDLLMK